MAVGTALTELRRMLRAEVTQSLGMTQGVNAQEQYDIMLARQQIELWEQYEWPHLEYRNDLTLALGQSDYAYPASMTFDSINKAYCWDGVSNNQPVFVPYRLPVEALTSTQSAWPISHWGNKAVVSAVDGKTTPAGMLKVFPTPAKAGKLILIGQAPCNPLVAGTDVAVLDDRLVVLFTAAEILAQQKNEGASLKLQKANQYVRRMLANQGGDKRRIHVLGGAQIAQSMVNSSSNGMDFRIPQA